MNILITGANGQLGNEMRLLAQSSPMVEQMHASFVFTDVNQVEGVETTYLDITDLAAIRQMVAEHQIQVIVNCAAYTNVDAAETNEAIAELLNAKAAENLAVAMREAGGMLVHVSTDYVFGKEHYNTPCKEDQQGTPTGVYGQTKLHGEQNILRVMSEDNSLPAAAYAIIRTAWLYSEFGKNFCKTMLNLTATKPQLKVVFDQVGTPTYALDLAEAILTIVCDYCQATHPYSKSGIYHYSNEGVCSWFDFTKMIQSYAEELGYYDQLATPCVSPRCDVQPCHSSEFPSPVTRPSFSVLDKTKIKETFGIRVPYWTDSLKTCISHLKGI